MPAWREEKPLYPPDAPAKILGAARDDYEWGMAWCAVRAGMHPKDIGDLGPANFDGEDLRWIRVKNDWRRWETVPPEERERMARFLVVMKKKSPDRTTVWRRVKATCARAGYSNVGPRILRKTYILNQTRELGREGIDLIAEKAGCSRRVVMRHYLKLKDWEKSIRASKNAL